jgi:hypothetical protein
MQTADLGPAFKRLLGKSALSSPASATAYGTITRCRVAYAANASS